MSHRAQTSRADLLRALAHGVTSVFTLDAGDSGSLAFHRRPPAPKLQLRVSQPQLPEQARSPSTSPPQAETAERLPLQIDTIWAVVERSASPAPAITSERDVLTGTLDPISDKEAGPPLSAHRLIDFEDLVPWARLTPALRRRLSQARSAGVDLSRLCRAVANQQPMHRLPRRQTTRWHPDIVVALDFSPRLWPYRWDMHRLCEQLRRHCGRTGLSLRVMLHGPMGGWSEWSADDDAELASPQDWTLPPAGAQLLLVSDLGALAPNPVARAQWLQLVKQAQAAGVHVEALLPLGGAQLPSGFPTPLAMLRWSPDSHLRPELATNAPDQDDSESLDADFVNLMAMVACLRRVDVPLLRALRRLLPHRHGDAGLEGAVWNHPDVLAGMACEIDPLAAERWLPRFEALPVELQRQHRDLAARHHGHLRAALNHEEVLLHSAHAAGAATDTNAIAVATNFMIRVARTAQQAGDPAVQARWQGFVQDALRRIDGATARKCGKVYDRLLAADLSHRPADARSNLPDWADGHRVLEALQASAAGLRQYWIVEDGPQHRIQLQAKPPGPHQRALQSAVELDHVVVRHGAIGPRRLVALRGQTWALVDTAAAASVELESTAQRWVIAPVRRPRGAECWGLRRSSDGVAAPDIWCNAFDGSVLNIGGQPYFQAPDAAEPDQRFHLVSHDWLRWADLERGGYGLDRHGLYFDLVVGSVPQRLRYIPPGQFLMGSPDGVGHDDERPQHQVTFIEGYWLADTPCTQAMWQAVIGDNPSEFKQGPGAAERPVENVSFDDVQTFLQRLRKLLPPGCEPTLPTEAQWEYAARAGTSTAYWWGDKFDPTKANVDVNNDKEVDGSKGATTPVRRYPPNPWGLHDVHGNVWERCLDDRRPYAPDPVRDPHGDLESSRRAVRGGSWVFRPDFARSAYRDGEPRFIADQTLGFRLSLRSPAPAPVAGGPGQVGGTGGPAIGAGRPGAPGAMPRPQGALDIDLDALHLEAAFEETARKPLQPARLPGSPAKPLPFRPTKR